MLGNCRGTSATKTQIEERKFSMHKTIKKAIAGVSALAMTAAMSATTIPAFASEYEALDEQEYVNSSVKNQLWGVLYEKKDIYNRHRNRLYVTNDFSFFSASNGKYHFWTDYLHRHLCSRGKRCHMGIQRNRTDYDIFRNRRNAGLYRRLVIWQSNHSWMETGRVYLQSETGYHRWWHYKSFLIDWPVCTNCRLGWKSFPDRRRRSAGLFHIRFGRWRILGRSFQVW